MLRTNSINVQTCTYLSSFPAHLRQTNTSILSRTICTLFLGWTFWLAIQYLFIHIWIDIIPTSLQNRSRSLLRRVPITIDIEEKSDTHITSPTSTHSDSNSITGGHTCKILLLLLNLSVAAAAIGTFVSLLTFNESNAAGSCGEYISFLITLS